MGLIPESVIEEVLARADIVDTVRRYVNLKKSGKNWKGLCPFHDDHDPSLKVHSGKQIYKCFACGAGGNAIGFLMEIEGWSFPEAVRQLADRNGVEIPEQDSEAERRARRRRNQRKQYYRIMEIAGEYYSSNLWGDPGRGARMYLEERGIDEETAREFGLGYAPDGWEHLLGHLHREGIDGEQAESAGLALERKSGSGHYDRFRHRIVFPVVDIWRNIRAFGGRTLAEDDDVPKYMNSPETPFYTKGEHLYGLHVAKKYFNDEDFALLVEGNFDVIALHAAGVCTAVAPMGTALTERQAELLSRYTQNVVVAFDGDSAGAKATRGCLEALQSAGLEGRVIRFDEADDPDTFVRREGADALRTKVDRAKPIVEWALDTVLVEDAAPVEKKVSALERAADVLDEVQNDVVWNHYAGEISRKLSIEPDLLEKYLRRPGSARKEAQQAVVKSHRPLELDPAESSLLAILLEHPEWCENFIDDGFDIMLASDELARLIGRMREHHAERGELATAVFLEQIDDTRLHETVVDALDETTAEDVDDLDFYYDCVRTIKRKYAERGLSDIEDRMDQLNFDQDREKLEELNNQWQKFVQLKNESLDATR